MHIKSILIVLSIAAAMVLTTLAAVSAGDPNIPPGPPETTYSYRLEDIYNRIESGAAGSPVTFTEPISGPAVSTGHTLDEIMAVAPQVDDLNGAAADHVLAGKVFWSLQSGSWGLETGTMPNKGIVIIAPGTERFDIAPGYYMGGGYVAGDADLLAENVAEGVNIFGVNGSHASEIHYEAGVPKTGQTSCFTTTNESQTVCPVEGYPGQDGDNLSGVEWPAPRFVESDGVVADNLTGLVWLQDANCLKTEEYEYDGLVTWPEALDFIAGITATGPYSNCAAGFSDWRMPSLLEMQSLIDYGYYDPAVPNAQGDGKWTEGDPFFNLQSHYYWTGSSYVHEPSRAWTVVTTDGNVNYEDKTGHTYYLWPVRGGQ